jgi:hypothetical protein
MVVIARTEHGVEWPQPVYVKAESDGARGQRYE